MKKLLALFLICISVNTFAITNVSGKVARIYPAENKVYFNLIGDQCGQGIDNHYYYFVLDSEIKKAWFSIILAAANTGKPILVSLPNCPSPATGAQVEIRYLYQDFN